MKLHNYFRSSTSFRVRIALALKGLPYDYVPYALLPNEHQNPDYLSLNPQGLVPSLELSDGRIISQSMAIIDYLDSTYPEPKLIYGDGFTQAQIRATAQMIACDIHPIGNLRVLRRLETQFGADKTVKTDWMQYWFNVGFEAIEKRLQAQDRPTLFCHGDTPSLADICLYAQNYNNERWGVDGSPFPRINAILENCDAIPAFRQARPENQMDAP